MAIVIMGHLIFFPQPEPVLRPAGTPSRRSSRTQRASRRGPRSWWPGCRLVPSPPSTCTATPWMHSSGFDHSVELPHVTTAAIQVETLLGVVDVTLKPVSGWSDPLKSGAFIRNTTVPTEFYQLQNTAHSLLSKTNAKALNSLVTSLASITKDKRTQVAQIIAGLACSPARWTSAAPRSRSSSTRPTRSRARSPTGTSSWCRS